MARRLCNGKWRNGKCKKLWVQKRCSATCGHTKPHGCCGNKMNDRRCNRLKPYCKRNWKIANRCEKACGKCKWWLHEFIHLNVIMFVWRNFWTFFYRHNKTTLYISCQQNKIHYMFTLPLHCLIAITYLNWEYIW